MGSEKPYWHITVIAIASICRNKVRNFIDTTLWGQVLVGIEGSEKSYKHITVIAIASIICRNKVRNPIDTTLWQQWLVYLITCKCIETITNLLTPNYGSSDVCIPYHLEVYRYKKILIDTTLWQQWLVYLITCKCIETITNLLTPHYGCSDLYTLSLVSV